MEAKVFYDIPKVKSLKDKIEIMIKRHENNYFIDRELDYLTPKVEAPPEKSDIVYEKLNKKEEDNNDDGSNKFDALTNQVRQDGLPELQYVFSNG